MSDLMERAEAAANVGLDGSPGDPLVGELMARVQAVEAEATDSWIALLNKYNDTIKEQSRKIVAMEAFIEGLDCECDPFMYVGKCGKCRVLGEIGGE